MESDHVFIILGCVVCAFIGAWIGEAKGRRSAGFFLSLLLGPLGILITCFLPAEEKRSLCHRCKKQVTMGSPFCPSCGADQRGDMTVECPFCKREFAIEQ
jgi:hypothetical protein